MTREEHIQWCKDRAKREIEYSGDPTQGLISMMSDLGKHPETADHAAILLCVGMIPHIRTKQAAIDFIEGFN